MLLYFNNDPAMGISIYGGSSESGRNEDFNIILREGKSFGGISYKNFKEHDQGTILWDPVKKTGEILVPDDPRWDEILKKKPKGCVIS
jgi:hypothetical protein